MKLWKACTDPEQGMDEENPLCSFLGRLFIEEREDYIYYKNIQKTDTTKSCILSEITLNASVEFQYVLSGSYI